MDPPDAPEAPDLREPVDGPGTGRLFRSLRAEGATADEALPALRLDEVVGLRSVTLRREPPRGPGLAPPEPSTAIDLPVVVAPLPAPTGEPLPAPAEPLPAPAPSGRPGRRIRRRVGLPWWGVGLIVVLPTIAAAAADIAVTGGIGWLTGAVLVVVAAIGALVVARPDDVFAVFSPPIALLVATLTVGQLSAPPVGNFWLDQAFLVTDVLGRGAPLLFAATGLALAIILVRRRRP